MIFSVWEKNRDKLFSAGVVPLISMFTRLTNAMKHFTTLTEAMEDMRGRGYTVDFAPAKEYLKATTDDNIKLRSDEFTVDELHRFEGASDPGDEMTLYGISATNGMKGVFVSAQGTYANEVSPELMAKFNVSHPNVNTEGAVQPITPIGAGQ